MRISSIYLNSLHFSLVYRPGDFFLWHRRLLKSLCGCIWFCIFFPIYWEWNVSVFRVVSKEMGQMFIVQMKAEKTNYFKCKFFSAALTALFHDAPFFFLFSSLESWVLVFRKIKKQNMHTANTNKQKKSLRHLKK